jgi:hypothetical protein
MSHADRFRRPALSHLVLDHLGVAPGPVNDLFVVKNLFCSTPDGIYAVQHVLRSLVSSNFKCAINQTIDAEIIIRCFVPSDVESLDGEKLTFKFDDKLVKFYKVVHVSLAPNDEDVASHPTVRPFPAFMESNLLVGYPRGYSDETEDMEKHMNPYISESTLKALNIEVGQTKGVLKVNVKYMNFPGSFMYAIHVIPFKDLFSFAVD